MLELHALKVARAVLRGGGVCNNTSLPDRRETTRMGDAGFELLRLSPLTRFADPMMMAEEVHALEADGYRCVRLDCSAWAGEPDFHIAVAAALSFPDYYGHNLDAFNDCIKSLKVVGHRGLVLVFTHWEGFARVAGDRAWHVLDIIACASCISSGTWAAGRRRTRHCSRRRGHVAFLGFIAHPAPAAAELSRSAALASSWPVPRGGCYIPGPRSGAPAVEASPSPIPRRPDVR